MNINEKVRAARIDAGMTQKELAEKLSLTESTVQKWETQKNRIGTEYLKELSNIFHISIEDLIDDDKRIVLSGEIIELYTESREEHPSDLKPHVVYSANLKKGGKLHRFENAVGTQYSAIYLGNREIFSCERAHEKDMLAYWNNMD